MKRPLDEAAELFRENEALAGKDKERANLYRALGLLTEGVRRLERELAEVEAERQDDGPSGFFQRRRTRLIRKQGQVIPAKSASA